MDTPSLVNQRQRICLRIIREAVANPQIEIRTINSGSVVDNRLSWKTIYTVAGEEG